MASFIDTVHATSVAIQGDGVLIRGPAGSGKSDLALRLMDSGADLVADDYTLVELIDGRVVISPPQNISGMMEVRGIGVMHIGTFGPAPLIMIVDLVAHELIARLPEHNNETIMGMDIPLIEVDPFEPSASAKVAIALKAIKEKIFIEDGHKNTSGIIQ